MIHLPGIATAHSHAFQRALRGRTHAVSKKGESDFWSWRNLMYQTAQKLTPELIYDVSRYAYAELALSGVTAVGEFHYVHHDENGAAYADRTELSQAVIRAALDVGIRITLLRVVYERAGAGRAPEPEQRRFCDSNIDTALSDVESLLSQHENQPQVAIGIAPHSVRAVSRDWVKRAHAFSAERGLPFHMHVSEQPKELAECQAEHGLTPVAMLHEDGIIDSRFVAVHATHLEDAEVAMLGPGFVCVCRTTERDLGDGLPRMGELVASGARLCLGVDSHAQSDPFIEARAVELDERSRTLARCQIDPDLLIAALGAGGYAAIGLEGMETEDRVELDENDAALVGCGSNNPAVLFAARAAAVRNTWVGDTPIVVDGALSDFERIRANYLSALKELDL